MIAESQLKRFFADLSELDCPGIYAITRVDELGIRFAYVGQSKCLRNRLISHLGGYSQRIDISLKSRGLLSSKKPNGWKIEKLCSCEVEELDNQEKLFIKDYFDKGFQMYNVTYGGQETKVGSNNHKPTKNYTEGKVYGYNKARKEISKIVKQYLDVTIKGKDSKLKQRMLAKFNEFIDIEVD